MARMTPPKSPMVCEKYQMGCMWRLYGLFDFRQGHSAKKLISDKKHSNRFDKKISKINKVDLLTSLDEMSQGMDDKMQNKAETVDSGMASKRKHKEEKLSTELQMIKNLDSDKSKHMQSNSKLGGPLPKKKGKASRGSQISQSISSHGPESEAKNRKSSYISVEKSLNKLHLEALAEEVHGEKQKGCGCKSINYEITVPQVKKNAAEAIIIQKFIDEKYIRTDGVNHQSRQLSDALEILNSNKELFRKLLQDPNSLLAKRIEDLKESQAVKHQMKSPSDINSSELKQCDGPAGIQKSKFCDSYSSKESDDALPSDKIVILKPGPNSMQSAEDNIECSSMQSSYNRQSEMPENFSFSQITKKLRHAIGASRKKKLSKAMDDTLNRSPCDGSKEDCEEKGVEIKKRGLIISPLDVKKRDDISWERECESLIQCETASTSGSGLGNSNISALRDPRRKESDSSVEARLLELLNSGNNGRQGQKTLERVISFPEYDFLPTRSPVGLSPYSNRQLSYDYKWRLQKEKITCSSPTENKHIMHRGETNSLEVPSESESACTNGTLETNDTVNPVETNSLEGLRRSHCVENTGTGDTNETIYQGETDSAETLSEVNCKDKALDWSTDQANMYEEDEYFKTSIQEQPSTSSPDVFQSPTRIGLVEDSASIDDKGEHPSPVSVLEQFFVDAISEPAEEHNSAPLVRSPTDCSTSSLHDHELISEYVQAVLQAANLDWEEVSMMCDSTDQLLDPFLFDTIKLQANQLFGDCMLLFDCIDEGLVEVYHSDLRYLSWLSFLKPNVRQLQIEKTVIHNVMKYVDRHLSLDPSPRTLQQVVEMDIARSGTWIDIRKDAEDIVFQMVDDVIEELIIETIS